MKLISWNVNGLRACLTHGFADSFAALDADIFSVQETKMQPGQADFAPDGYTEYTYSAEKKGYSGTACWCREQPLAVTTGIGIEEHDHEGRVLTLEYPGFYLVNCYTPNSQDGLKRLDYRMEWENAFRAYLLGLDAPCPPPGFEPLPAMVRVPLIGSIACGTPITAEQNIERYIGVPAAWRADFALTCHGSSMAPTICDGDIVCIRCQPEVEQGEIAAVRIGGEATLKHFHRQGDAVMLLADNAAVCPPMIFTGLQLEELHIEGRAVGLCRGL